MDDDYQRITCLLLLPYAMQAMRVLDYIDPNNYFQAIVDMKNFVGFYIFAAFWE